MRIVHPPALRPGDRVAVVCPASPAQGDRLSRGVARLRSLGFEVAFGPTCATPAGLWAGSDADRAAEMIGYLRDPSIRAVFAGRGGVGCQRLLPYLASLPADTPPCWLVGRSDLTALHLSLWGRLGWVGQAGPMVATDLGGENPLPRVEEASLDLLAHRTPIDAIRPAGLEVWNAGDAEGWLLPVNLSLLASMVGTPYLPPLDGAVLVLEDIGETPQRIDRMMTQLEQAGALDDLAGLVVGQFTGCAPRDPGLSPDLWRTVVRDHAQRIGVPAIAGFPFGHEPDFVPLPFGARARLEHSPPGLRLEAFADS